MKKLSYILLVAVTILVSCRKHDTLQESPEDAWIYDMSLPVPIQFGSAGPVTKTLLEESTLPEVARVGVYAYDKACQSLVTETLLLKNEKARGEGGSLTFVNGKKYYPLESTMNYTFTGYYPIKDNVFFLQDSNLSSYFSKKTDNPINNKAVYVTKFEGLGYDDIIFAKSEVTEEMIEAVGTDGFNAKYIRAVHKLPENEQAGNKPNMKFEHLLTALRFNVKAAETEDASNVTVTGFRIKDASTSATLVVASVDKNYPAGHIEFSPPKTGSVITMTSSGTSDGSKVFDRKPTKEGVKLGELILAPATSYNCEMDLRGADNKLYTTAFTINSDFKQGSIYNLTVTVHNMVAIDVTYTIDEWDVGNDPIKFEQGGTESSELVIG